MFLELREHSDLIVGMSFCKYFFFKKFVFFLSKVLHIF